MYTSFFRKAMLGDTATLNLDFTTGVLDSRLTFTRASTATYINSSGYIASMAAAVTNDPTKARFDYDPTTLAPRGLLIEGSAINYMLYSVDLTQTNSKMRAVSTASITDPEGTTDKARIVAADGQAGYHARYLATTAGTNTTVTISIFAKKNGYKYLYISDLSLGRAAVRFDLDDGSTSNSSGAGFVSASATAYPNGWWRCSLVSTVTASTSYGWGYVGAPLTGATYAAAGVQYTGENLDDKGIYCYGFQVEGGAGASSYIPTAASQVTRNAEECRMTGTNFSSWFAGATEGVFFAEYEKPRKLGSQDYVALSTVYAAGALLNITTNTGTLYPASICWPTGGALFPGGITTACPADTKRAIRWFNGNDFSNFADGVLGTTSNGTGTLTMTMLNVGATTNTGTSSTSDWLNSCIKKIKFYPTALPNADIQTLTAP
jgi:hypothetical protein